MKIIFRQSLILDCNHIKTLWDKTLSIGTDTYRLKFHNKLLSTYQDKQETLSMEDCMVFIESYYHAASVYFFWRSYKTALYKIRDGIKFGHSVHKQLFKDDSINKYIKDLNSWLWLCESLKQDILIYTNPETTLEHNSDVSTIKLNSNASVLIYRKYFLDDDLEECKKKSLEILATENYKSIEDNNIIYTKYNLMYKYLLLASFGKTEKVKLDNVINAIRLPVLSIEDRLLNYKALLITMDMLHICLDEKELLDELEACEPMNSLKKNDSFFREIIIPRLKNVYYAMHDKDIIMKLIFNLSTKDAIINERILHVIVTSAIDIAELDQSKYITHIKTIKTAIKVLRNFVKVFVVEKEKSEKNKTEKDNKCESEEIETEYYSEKMVELLSNSTPDKKTKNVFIAYKWLAELYGVLCDPSNHLTKYQRRLKLYIGLADKIIDGNDDHLKYLKNKQDAKILLANNSWEVNSWPGGWNFSNLKTETSKILDTYTNEKKSNMLKDLNSLRNKSKCPYVNKIEINILLYRLYVMDSDKNEYKELHQYLAKAINEVVITSEDRARNMEAHELLSMYLMIQNRHSIEQKVPAIDYFL
eukprot:XP_016658606.1 PREDICTED: uncharacterized protein LOC100570038 isoform X2 [Acyrthosiphon pisum]